MDPRRGTGAPLKRKNWYGGTPYLLGKTPFQPRVPLWRGQCEATIASLVARYLLVELIAEVVSISYYRTKAPV